MSEKTQERKNRKSAAAKRQWKRLLPVLEGDWSLGRNSEEAFKKKNQGGRAG